MQYQQNLGTNTEYLMIFPPDKGTPKLLRIGMWYSAIGEWNRFIIPYPAGTTFPLSAQGMSAISACDDIGTIASWANCSFTQVTSKTDLGPNKYYWDSTKNLLWVHLQTMDEEYEFVNGRPYPDHSEWVYITATCPNDDCTVAQTTLNSLYASLYASPTPYRAPATNLCEKNNFGNIGLISYTQAPGTPTVVLFDDALQLQTESGLQLSTWSYLSQQSVSSLVYQGNAALEVEVGDYGTVFFEAAWNKEIDLSSFLSASGGEPAIQFALRISDVGSPMITSDTQQLRSNRLTFRVYLVETRLNVDDPRQWIAPVSAPYTYLGQPNTSWIWVTVPFSVFAPDWNTGDWSQGVALPTSGLKLQRVGIGMSHGFPVMFYIDQVQFARVTKSTSDMGSPNYVQLHTPGSTLDPANIIVPEVCAANDPSCTPGQPKPSNGSSGLSGAEIGLIILGAALLITIIIAVYFAIKANGSSSSSSGGTSSGVSMSPM
jgi:hypothetical protein